VDRAGYRPDRRAVRGRWAAGHGPRGPSRLWGL